MINYFVPKPQYLWQSPTGTAPVIGRVQYFAAGTSTPKAIYDKTGTPLQNPLPTDDDGYTPAVFLGEGSYKVILQRLVSTDPTDTYETLWEVDEVKGAETGAGAGVTTALVNTIAELKALSAGAYSLVSVLGYFAAGDGGGGPFRWNPVSTTTDDGGTWIIPASAPANGRWVRQYSYPEVTGAMYGSPLNSGETQDARLLNLVQFAKSTGFKVTLQAGVYKVGANVTLDPAVLEMQEGAKFRRFSTGYPVITLAPQTLIADHFGTMQDEVANFPTISPKTPIYARPEWWGADGTGTADAYSAIKTASEQLHGLVEFAKSYKLTAAGAPAPSIMVKVAKISATASFNFAGGGASRYFVINSVQADPTTMGVFGGATCRQELGIKGETRAEWFYSTNASSTAGHQQTAMCVCSGASSWRGKLSIGYGDSGALTWDYVAPSFAELYSCDVRIVDGLTLNIGGGATDYATRYVGATLDSVGGGVVGANPQNAIVTDAVYPEPFGAFGGGATSGASAALALALQVAARNNLMVDGRGKRYDFVNAILVNHLGTYGIKDAHLYAQGTDCLTSTLTTGVRTLSLLRCRLECSNTSLFAADFSTNTETSFEVSDCSFVGVAQIKGGGSISGTRFGAASLGGSSSASREALSVVGCRIASGGCYGFASFYGCTFAGGFQIYEAEAVTMQGNHFRSSGAEALRIGSTSGTTIAKRLIVTGNTFAVGVSTTPIVIDSAIAAYGHDAMVFDNAHPYGGTLQTRTAFTFSKVVSGGGSGVEDETLIDSASLTVGRCLPYQKNPKAWVAQICGVSLNGPNLQDRHDSEARLMPASATPADYSLYLYNPSANSHNITAALQFNWEKP